MRRTAATSRYGINNGWTYDDRGRMLTESTTYSGQTYQVGYRYDSRGRLDEITYPSGRKAAYTFDQRGALDLIKWESSTIEDRGYDDLARLNNVDRPGVDETRSYDDAGRLTAINNTNVGDATYTYDANHNKLSESWTGAMAAWNFLTTNTGTNPDGYDKEDRFVHFKQATQSKTFDFGRSDIGNINNINLNGTGTTRGFNNIHALTSIGSSTQAFDENGNQTTSHAGHTQSWDEAGMMKQSVVPAGSPVGVAGTNEYGYDVDRKRVWKKITRNSSVAEHTVYIHAGPNLIAEYPEGTAAASPAQEYVYAQEIDSLVMLVRSTGGGSGNEKLAITRNQQWSVTALTDSASGTVLERYTYDHFGKRTILEANGTTVRATSSYNMPFGYTSRQHDAETGLMYFRARYFDPNTAEFISPDPLVFVDGLSLFRGYFVGLGTDPSGLMKMKQTGTKAGRCGGYSTDFEFTAENPRNGAYIVYVQKICSFKNAYLVECEMKDGCCGQKKRQDCKPCCWIEILGGGRAGASSFPDQNSVPNYKKQTGGCSSKGSYSTTATVRAYDIELDRDTAEKINEINKKGPQVGKCDSGCGLGTKEGHGIEGIKLYASVETSADDSRDPDWWKNKGAGVFDEMDKVTKVSWSCCGGANWQLTKFPDTGDKTSYTNEFSEEVIEIQDPTWH